MDIHINPTACYPRSFTPNFYFELRIWRTPPEKNERNISKTHQRANLGGLGSLINW